MTAPASLNRQPNKVEAPSEGRSRLQLWRDIWTLFREFWTAHPLAMLGSVLLLLVGNARVGGYVTAMRGMIDALVRGASSQEAQGHSALFWVSVYIGASAMEQFYWAARSILEAYLRDHGMYRIQRRVLERAAAAPLIQFEEGAFFDQLQRAADGMGDRLVTLFTRLMDLGQLLAMLASLAVVMYAVHPVLLPLLVFGTLPSVWFHARVATAVYEVNRAHTTRDRVRSLLQKLLTGRDAASELRVFGTAGFLLGRWQELRQERSTDMLVAEKRRALFGATGSLISTLAYTAGLVLVAALIFRGRLSVGDYVAVSTGALWFQEMLSASVSVVRWLEEESHFLGDLFDFLRFGRVEPSAVERTADAVAAGAVEAEGVTFTYPGRSTPVLQEVHLRIKPGERIAIVGENGAGKSTLVKLLIGLYQADGGAVRVGGRGKIAAVFQDYASFQLTARENIGFGNLALIDDDEALTGALQRAGIAQAIDRLPQGIDTYLGRQFGDRELSGGQWQRMALARAFLRDADLIVLDEPTAALDPLAELALFDRFIKLVEGRTAIMVSHRLGAARLADRILVLREGKIVESGGHEELLASGGEYARLFAAQAQWYR
ncbi:MAG TPA: ABC transporter ATP-binding protein [Symbiobacteriaceae bacterium]|jgi:ABC-type multidrug transport system fused ATPase/permease subunit|nr:ABC transporter ATP-binding protein [Symbiobacteriaceae bacterium]